MVTPKKRTYIIIYDWDVLLIDRDVDATIAAEAVGDYSLPVSIPACTPLS
jgi:hypothetical protein